MSARISKGLVVDGKTLVTEEAWNAELEIKHQQVVEWLHSEELGGVLFQRTENVAWLTGGAVNTRVLRLGETGVGSILVTADGRRCYMTTANEALRLHEEEFSPLDFEPMVFPWYDDQTEQTARELAHGRLAADRPTPGCALAHMKRLRTSLQGTEIARYRWLGEHTAAAVVEVLRGLEPGITEYEMEARLASALLRQGITPSVLLIAVDERILKYKHAVSRGHRLKKFAMLNLCARRWGLSVSLTRFAHIGPVPAGLQEKFHSSAQVNAALLDATQVGVASADLFKVAVAAYAAAGFAGEEQLHHQGGATGYWEREWLATPDGTERVLVNQAFAWNPSIRGGKVEDTVLLHNGRIELLTPTPELPALESSANGNFYPATGVLEL